jgi:hypothetical protein
MVARGKAYMAKMAATAAAKCKQKTQAVHKVKTQQAKVPKVEVKEKEVKEIAKDEVKSLDSDESSEEPEVKIKPTKIARCSDCNHRCDACFYERKVSRKRARAEAGTSQGDSPALQQWRTYYKDWCVSHAELCEGKQMSERAKIAGVFYRHERKHLRVGDEELHELYGIK